MKKKFQADLLAEEEILWTGQAEPGVYFTKADIFLIPFSLLWGGFSIFWEVSVLGMGAPFFFKLWGIPFVLLGLYFIFGRFIYKQKKKENTYYAVTNKRVLILNELFNKNLRAKFIEQIPSINKNMRNERIGSIEFGTTPFFAGMYANTGMDFFGKTYGDKPFAFYEIKDVDKVYRLVNDLRRQPKSD